MWEKQWGVAVAWRFPFLLLRHLNLSHSTRDVVMKVADLSLDVWIALVPFELRLHMTHAATTS